MKNKKGFTIVELLAVLAILAVLITLTTSSIFKMMEKNKDAAYETKKDLILKQAKQYVEDNETLIYNSTKNYGNYACVIVKVSDLVSNGYLDNKDKDMLTNSGDVLDPRDNSSMLNVNIMLYIKSKYSPTTEDYQNYGKYVGDLKSTLNNTSDCH